MSFFQRGDARLHYEVHGDGFPVLALAAGGIGFDFLHIDFGGTFGQSVVSERRHQRWRVVHRDGVVVDRRIVRGLLAGFTVLAKACIGARREIGVVAGVLKRRRVRIGSGGRREIAGRFLAKIVGIGGWGARRRCSGRRRLRAGRARFRFGFGNDAADKGRYRGWRGWAFGRCKPGRLAAGTAHGTAGGPERGRLDHVGRGAVRADDQHRLYCAFRA